MLSAMMLSLTYLYVKRYGRWGMEDCKAVVSSSKITSILYSQQDRGALFPQWAIVHIHTRGCPCSQAGIA